MHWFPSISENAGIKDQVVVFGVPQSQLRFLPWNYQNNMIWCKRAEYFVAYGRRARPGLMQAISIFITPASCEYDILDLPRHAKSPHPDSPPPTPRRTHIFGLQSRITSTPLSRSGQSVNQPVCKLEVRVNSPEDIALHHHVKVIFFAYFLAHHYRHQVQIILTCAAWGLVTFIAMKQ